MNNLLEDTHPRLCIKRGGFIITFPPSRRKLIPPLAFHFLNLFHFKLPCRLGNSAYQISSPPAHSKMQLIHITKRHQQNHALGSTAMTFSRTENGLSLSRARMNSFVHMYTLMLVTNSFARLAILYVFVLRLFKRIKIDFVPRLIFYSSWTKLATTKMAWMLVQLVEFL